jgi:hypothetical protein
LLLKDRSPVACRFFNTLADEAALVPVRSVRRVPDGGRLFDKDGNRVPQQGAQYKGNSGRVP